MTSKSATYPIALERDIITGGLTRARLENTDLVIWRSNSGNIHVWEDHCPHRSVRLSAGRNLGDSLQDIYHGWLFGEDGTVVSIPAECGKSYPKISANVIQSSVKNGLVWASLKQKPKPDITFKPQKNQQYSRPIWVNASMQKISRYSLPSTPDLHLRISPASDDACVIFGICKQGDPALRDTNDILNILRSNVEGASR